MLAMSARIIGANIASYLFIALLIVVVGMLRSLGLLGDTGGYCIIAAFTYLGAILPPMILHDISLRAAVARCQEPEGRITFFKVLVIAFIMVDLSICLFFKILVDRALLGAVGASDYALFLAIVALVLPLAPTLLGSWVPAGVVRKEHRLMPALRRGVMSLHTVYWRLVLSLCLFVALAALLGVAYFLVAGTAPVLSTNSGDLQALGIIYWFIAALFGLFLLTYTTVVICICYLRAEKIGLNEVAPSPTPA